MKIYVGMQYVEYEGNKMVSVNEDLKELKESLDRHVLELGGLVEKINIETWENGKCTNSEEYNISEVRKQAHLDYMEWCKEYDRKTEEGK